VIQFTVFAAVAVAGAFCLSDHLTRQAQRISKGSAFTPSTPQATDFSFREFDTRGVLWLQRTVQFPILLAP
jgi:hypothetical protein